MQDSAGGETGSTKSGGGILDFFGGSSNNQSSVPQAKDGITLASNTMSHNSGFVYLLAEGNEPHCPRWPICLYIKLSVKFIQQTSSRMCLTAV